MNSIVNSKVNKMAREAWGEQHEIFWFDDDGIERFAALVRADEREADAKLVDHILKEGGGTYGDAIRARGNT